jgi:glycosyltransferase involved in cell wall biosynthesis
MGHAWEARKTPERGMAIFPLNYWYGKLAVLAGVLLSPASFFVHYYFDPRRIEFGFRPLKTVSTYAVLLGYVYGWQRYGHPLSGMKTYLGQESGAAERTPVRVLYVDAFPKIGGGQQVLLAIITRLDRTQYEPVVALSPGNPLRSRLDDAGVRSVGIQFDEASYTLPNPSELRSVLHTATSLVRVLRSIALLARHERVRLIHANSVVAGLHALPSALWLQIPCVVYAHDFNTAPSTNRLLSILMRYVKSAAIFVSQALVDDYRKNGLLTYPYTVIHNGTDTHQFRPRADARESIFKELGLALSCYLIGCVGRLERGKGHKLLLESFAKVAHKHPQARLVIAGSVVFDHVSGIERDLRAQVKRLGLDDKVIFVGYREDTPTLMAGLDVLAHCPIEPESFGLVVIEAMACARPVVTVPSGGIREIVSHGVNGLLVPVGDSAGIASAISRLIQDPGLAQSLGEAGRRTVQEQFSVERQGAQVQRIYAELLRRRS